MTVRELITRLQALDPKLIVVLEGEREHERVCSVKEIMWPPFHGERLALISQYEGTE